MLAGNSSGFVTTYASLQWMRKLTLCLGVYKAYNYFLGNTWLPEHDILVSLEMANASQDMYTPRTWYQDLQKNLCPPALVLEGRGKRERKKGKEKKGKVQKLSSVA